MTKRSASCQRPPRRRQRGFIIDPYRFAAAGAAEAAAIYADLDAWFEFSDNAASTYIAQRVAGGPKAIAPANTDTMDTAGKVGGALQITKSQVIELNSRVNTQLDYGGDVAFTIFGWFKAATGVPDYTQYLLGRWFTTDNNRAWALFRDITTGAVGASISGDGSASTVPTSIAVDTTTPVFNFVAIRHDPVANTFALRVNATTNSSSHSTGVFATADANTAWGPPQRRLLVAVNGAGTTGQDITLNQWGFCGAALTDAQLDYLYNSGNGKSYGNLLSDSGNSDLTGEAWPTIWDDNALLADEGLTTTHWSVTTGTAALSQSGSTVRFTNNAASSAQATRTSFAAPTSNDYIFVIRARANYQSTKYAYFSFRDGTTAVFDLIFGYNYETSAAQLGTISTWNYPTSAGNNIATGVDYSAADQEFAIHVDRNRSCVNLWYRVSGKWDFRGSYAYSAGYASLDDVKMVCSSHSSHWIEFDHLLICRPNATVIGDSIAAGHNFFDPNPSVYGGEDNASNTWQKHALIYQSLRNNLLVNKGIGSETSTTTAARIAEATAHAPRTVFLHASSNDEAGAISKATRSTNIQSMVTASNLIGAKAVLLNAMYGTDAGPDNTPTNDLKDYMLDWWNNYRPTDITGQAKTIDIMQAVISSGFQDPAVTESDGIHPTAAGYQAIGELIATSD